jgi:adenine deaminase
MVARGERPADLYLRVDVALSRGRRVEGHTAGASAETLPAIVVAGLTSDHELSPRPSSAARRAVK